MTPMLEAACRYPLDGIPIFPCRNKSPLTAHGFKDASLDAQQILAWWTENPSAQIGIPTGKASGIFVVDLDGPEALAWAEAQDLPPTRTVETSPGRRQLWFAQPAGITTKSTASVLAPHVDTRGDGGYVIAPPSLHHEAGTQYHFVDEAPMAPIPLALIASANSSHRSRADLNADEAVIAEGRRNVELTRRAGYWRAEGKDLDQILALLRLENERRCRPPLPYREIEAIARSIGGKPTTIESPEIIDENEQVDSNGAPNLPEIAWRGVFEKYREALDGVTEASDAFHFASLWARIATALGRRVAFDYGMTLYANVYIVCFGPTADRKTTATRKARELSPRFPLIVGGGSGEGLAEEFSKIMMPGEGMMLYVEEFSQLLRAGKWSGATLLPFLTQCFDCPDLYQLKFRKAPVEIKQPTPTLLSCTTADWFWRDFDIRDFAGGYGNRLAFFLGPRKAAIPLPRTPVLETIADSMAIIAAAPQCVARLSPNGRPAWEKFYRSWDASRSKRDPLLAAATERIPSYVLKLAMVYATIEATLPEITSEQLASAIAVGDYLVVSAEHVLSLQHAATNPRRELERRVLAHLAKFRTTTKRAISKALWRHYESTEEFNRAFDSLVRAGQIFTSPGLHGRIDVSTDPLI